jgi:ribosomal protein L11 methyltransferase
MPWLQLLAQTSSEHAPIIEAAFFNSGARSVTLKEYIPAGEHEKPILEPKIGENPLWDTLSVVGLFDNDSNTESIEWLLHQQLTPLNGLTPSLRWERLDDKDWEREWMENYHPIPCADKLWICPSWATPPDPDAVNIILDPGLAFGTGTHPTTFLCLQWLAKQPLHNTQIMDYGCGSGILGITALLLGAKQAIGIDIDPQALRASQDNSQRNQLSAGQLTLHLPQDCPQTQVDIMLANILAAPLIELADTLTSHIKPEGKICLSGILTTQAESVIAAYTHTIDFEPIIQKGEWVCLSGHKKTD